MADFTIGWFSGSPPTHFPGDPANAGTLNDSVIGSPFFIVGVSDNFDSDVDTAVFSSTWVPLTDSDPPTTDDTTAGQYKIQRSVETVGVLTITCTVDGTLLGYTCILTLSAVSEAVPYGTSSWLTESSGSGGGGGDGKLLIPPDETGYSITENNASYLSAALAGGAPRTRADVMGGGRIISAQWSGRAKRWQTVNDFFIQNVAQDCPSFLLDLIIETSEYEEYSCNVIPGSIKRSNPTGMYWVLQCQLEVAPIRYDLAADAWPGGDGGDGNPGTIVLFDDFSGTGTIDGRVPTVGYIADLAWTDGNPSPFTAVHDGYVQFDSFPDTTFTYNSDDQSDNSTLLSSSAELAFLVNGEFTSDELNDPDTPVDAVLCYVQVNNNTSPSNDHGEEYGSTDITLIRVNDAGAVAEGFDGGAGFYLRGTFSTSDADGTASDDAVVFIKIADLVIGETHKIRCKYIHGISQTYFYDDVQVMQTLDTDGAANTRPLGSLSVYAFNHVLPDSVTLKQIA